MEPLVLLSPEEGRAANIYRPKYSIASAGLEPANLVSNGKHANHYTTEATYYQSCYLLPRTVHSVQCLATGINI
jgi:hypothetical protein